MSADREKRIINGLVIICIVAGFAFFTLIALPDQLLKAGHAPAQPSVRVTQKLSTILPPEVITEEAPVTIPQESATVYSATAYDSDGRALAEVDEVVVLEPREEELRGRRYIETKVFPRSALSQGESSVLDKALALRSKSWLATPAGFEADVGFWRDIYSKYDSNKVVLHHPRYLSIKYGIVNLKDIDNDPRLSEVEREHLRDKRFNKARDQMLQTLAKLAKNPPSSSLSNEDWFIKKQFMDAGLLKEIAVSSENEEVRGQTGQRDRFEEGLKRSGRTMGEIESIFASYGIPREITRLIFVESMFETRAASSVGAAGIWQFMPRTGKKYLNIDDIRDERLDHIAATHASAKLLLENYEALGSWPLAINAYNSGRGRMKQAVKQVGSKNIGHIMRNFKNPSYQFASRNFFPEFLAALDVAEHGYRHFPSVKHDKPLRFELVRADHHISLPKVAKIAQIPMEEIVELNPSFGRDIVSGRRLLPIGFEVRVPEGSGELFLISSSRAPGSRVGHLKHKVKRGETMASIASMYGVSMSEMLKANPGKGRRPRRHTTVIVPFHSPVASYGKP
jgi:peptidoglycan lytic transglycosylase D